MIVKDIILEMSDLLTMLTYSIRKGEVYFELFISLKNLYDSIGYYTYNELDFKDIWSYSLITTQKLEGLKDNEENYNLKYRIGKVIGEVQKYLEEIHGPIDNLGITEFPKGFIERGQMEQSAKKLIWRFGCCLAICLRAGGRKEHQLLQFLFEFLDFLNNALYSSQGISMIENKLSHFEEEFNTISNKVGLVKYPVDIIKNEYDLTLKELKKLFTSQLEFKINEFITLKLIAGSTKIFVKGESFEHCKYLLLHLPVEELEDFEEIDSIDEIADTLKWTENGQQDENEELIPVSFTPEVEFWGHCSNIQVWAEHDYDTRLLHSNLSFPLLKRLTEVGDPAAQKVFQEEIYRRFESFYPNTILYLLEGKYLQFLTVDQKETLLLDWISKDIENVTVLLIGQNYLSQFGEQYRSLIVKDLSSHIEKQESVWLKGELGELFKELGIHDNKEFESQLFSKDRFLLKEIFDLRQYPVPKEAVGGVNYTHLGVMEEIKRLLSQLCYNDKRVEDLIIHQTRKLFEIPSVANMFSLLLYSFYKLIPLTLFKEMMKMANSPFLTNIFNYLGHEVMMQYFDSSLVPYDFLFTFFDEECRAIFGHKVRGLHSDLKKKVIDGISQRMKHKTYHDAVVKLLEFINRS